MKTPSMRIRKPPAFAAIMLFVVFTLINSVVSPSFMSISAWTGFLQSTVPIVVLSVGEAVVIIGGGIDISVGATVSVINTMMATLSNTNGPILIPIASCLLVAIAIGVLNGFLVAVLRIFPLLATFATSFIGNGLALTILATPGGHVPTALSDFYYGVLWGIFPVPLLFPVVMLTIWWLIRISPLGPYIYSTGHSTEKAYFSGVNVTMVRFIPYVYSGLAAGIAGIAVSFNFGAGDPRVGSSMTLNTIAACVIGGINLAGGSGSVAGAVFGALFLYEILITVLGFGVPAYFQDLVTGLTVLLGITLAVHLQRKETFAEAY